MKVDSKFSDVIHIDPPIGECYGEAWDKWIEESNKRVGITGHTYLYYGQDEQRNGWDFLWIGNVLYKKSSESRLWVKVVPIDDEWNTDIFAVCSCGETDFRILNYGEYFIEVECVSCRTVHKATKYWI